MGPQVWWRMSFPAKPPCWEGLSFWILFFLACCFVFCLQRKRSNPEPGKCHILLGQPCSTLNFVGLAPGTEGNLLNHVCIYQLKSANITSLAVGFFFPMVTWELWVYSKHVQLLRHLRLTQEPDLVNTGVAIPGNDSRRQKAPAVEELRGYPATQE